MRVIGVLDLMSGRAVHARAGRREQYEPVRAVGGEPLEPGDAVALASAYIDRFALRELYAADLDAISGSPLQTSLITRLGSLDAPLWLDAGVRSLEEAREAVALGASTVVVGLETLPSWDTLLSICDGVAGQVAFSLDLRHGSPITSSRAGDVSPDEPADRIAARAADAGVSAVIVIDLGRVGTKRGPDIETIVRIRDVIPNLTLVAGGGVRGPGDLERLAAAKCDGALVATALHEGRLNGVSACLPPQADDRLQT